MPFLGLSQPILDDGTGTAHPNAVYLPLDSVMVFKNQTGSVGWEAWHDGPTAVAFIMGTGTDGPLTQCAHRQQLGPVEYALDSNLQEAAGTFALNVSQSLVYVAKLIKDTPGKNADGTPQLDPVTNLPVMVSFFAAATVVTLG